MLSDWRVIVIAGVVGTGLCAARDSRADVDPNSGIDLVTITARVRERSFIVKGSIGAICRG